jgi:hypothetical protein
MKVPDDIHVVGRNASKTEPAKFLVVFVNNKGAPIPDAGRIRTGDPDARFMSAIGS